MSQIIILFTSFLLTVLPIFFVQRQRYLASLSLCLVESPHPASIRLSKHFHAESYDGAASDISSDESRDLFRVRSSGNNNNQIVANRKPWEPPFPTRSKQKGGHLVLPRADESGEAEDGVAQGGNWANDMNRNGLEREIERGKDLKAQNTYAQATPPTALEEFLSSSSSPTYPSQVSIPTSVQQHITEARSRNPSSEGRSVVPALSLIHIVILILATLLFFFVFAVLVAHCLAWFIVYKTEARLGEVRRGVVRGGEMRMCLCAR